MCTIGVGSIRGVTDDVRSEPRARVWQHGLAGVRVFRKGKLFRETLANEQIAEKRSNLIGRLPIFANRVPSWRVGRKNWFKIFFRQIFSPTPPRIPSRGCAVQG